MYIPFCGQDKEAPCADLGRRAEGGGGGIQINFNYPIKISGSEHDDFHWFIGFYLIKQ